MAVRLDGRVISRWLTLHRLFYETGFPVHDPHVIEVGWQWGPNDRDKVRWHRHGRTIWPHG